MKKLFISLAFSLLSYFQGTAQTIQKPKIMVMPDREWCIANNYVGDTGEPDFFKALQNEEFQMCVSEFSGIMADRDYPLKDLSSTLESFKNGKAKRLVMTGKDGSSIQENDEDMLARAATLDIKIRFNIKKISAMGRNQVQFIIKAVDAGTDDIIYSESLPPVVTTASAASVLKAAVQEKMDGFCQNLQKHFDRLYNEGRKCTVEFNISETCPYNMSSDVEYNGDEGEFADVLNVWLTQNSVNGSVSPLAKEDNTFSAEVNIPLFGESMGTQISLNAESWVKKLNKVLKGMGMQMKTSMFGQSKVYCIISGL